MDNVFFAGQGNSLGLSSGVSFLETLGPTDYLFTGKGKVRVFHHGLEIQVVAEVKMLSFHSMSGFVSNREHLFLLGVGYDFSKISITGAFSLTRLLQH